MRLEFYPDSSDEFTTKIFDYEHNLILLAISL